MELCLCKKCNRIFQYNSGRRICAQCQRKEEEVFFEIKDYLRENGSATMQELVDTFDVSVKLIEKFIREGRIELKTGGQGSIQCESCGQTIQTGRFCNTCKAKLTKELDGFSQDMKKAKQYVQPQMKMHSQFR